MKDIIISLIILLATIPVIIYAEKWSKNKIKKDREEFDRLNKEFLEKIERELNE